MITPEFAKAFLKKRELLDDEGSSAYEKTRKSSLDAYGNLLYVSLVIIATMFRVGNHGEPTLFRLEPILFWTFWFSGSITLFIICKEAILLWKIRFLFEHRRVIHIDELFSNSSTQTHDPSYAPLFGISRKERLKYRSLLALYALVLAISLWLSSR